MSGIAALYKLLIINKKCMRFGDATSSSDGFHTDRDVRLNLEEPKDNDIGDTAGSDDVI